MIENQGREPRGCTCNIMEGLEGQGKEFMRCLGLHWEPLAGCVALEAKCTEPLELHAVVH